MFKEKQTRMTVPYSPQISYVCQRAHKMLAAVCICLFCQHTLRSTSGGIWAHLRLLLGSSWDNNPPNSGPESEMGVFNPLKPICGASRGLLGSSWGLRGLHGAPKSVQEGSRGAQEGFKCPLHSKPAARLHQTHNLIAFMTPR